MVVTKCVDCGNEYEIEDDENPADFQCECGGNLIYLDTVSNAESLEGIEEDITEVKNQKQSKPSHKELLQLKLRAEVEDELRKLEEKKKKYGFLKVAKSISGQRLELYDYSIRLPGKQDYLIEDIISIDFKEANPGLLGIGKGYIKFNIRGMNKQQPGALLTYGQNTGLNVGMYGRPNPKTKIKFHQQWEPEFREIKDIIEAKILKSRELLSNEDDKNNLDDLEKLAERKQKGIITEEEFEAKKKEILSFIIIPKNILFFPVLFL